MTTTDTTTTTASVRTGLRRRAALAVAAIAAVLGTGIVAAAPAGATTSALSYYPTFGCTANSINVAAVPLNADIGNVQVVAVVYEWTGRWTMAAYETATVDTDQMFGELMDPTFDFNAVGNHFFAVAIYTKAGNDPWTAELAEALNDAYGRYYCGTV